MAQRTLVLRWVQAGMLETSGLMSQLALTTGLTSLRHKECRRRMMRPVKHHESIQQKTHGSWQYQVSFASVRCPGRSCQSNISKLGWLRQHCNACIAIMACIQRDLAFEQSSSPTCCCNTACAPLRYL